MWPPAQSIHGTNNLCYCHHAGYDAAAPPPGTFSSGNAQLARTTLTVSTTYGANSLLKMMCSIPRAGYSSQFLVRFL